MAYPQHQSQSSARKARCAIITLSDTRTPDTDESGKLIARLLTEHGHILASAHLIPDEPDLLRTLLAQLVADSTLNLIITNGGTGISPRDQTVPVIESMLSSPLPGFGELFRMLSYQEVGSGALLSRATGGVIGSTLIFALPGSTSAVDLAMGKLILSEIGHLLTQLAGGKRLDRLRKPK